jgi:hypothetical protein
MRLQLIIDEDLQDALPLPHNESMPSNQAILEIDPTEDEGAESDDSDSDYVPSDQEDEEFQADFEEDVNALTDDIEDSEAESSLTVSEASHRQQKLILNHLLNLKTKMEDTQRELIGAGIH